jgi:long-chain acyl-CoA synthetase
MEMVTLLKEYEPKVPSLATDVKKDLAHIGYTGGTTGLSKGVMLTHHNVVANTLQNASWQNGAQIEVVDGVLIQVFPPGVDPKRDRWVCRDRERALVVVPWFHVMGTILFLNMHVYNGTTMVVFSRFDPQEYLDAVTKYGITVVGGSPQLFIPLVNNPDFESHDLSGIRIANLGAAPLPLPLLDKLLDAFSGVVCDGYGLTECTCGAVVNPPEHALIRPGSVGLPLFDTECKVVDPDTGRDLPVGSEGEICIRGPQVMKGYWNKPEETDSVLKDGWLFSGDIGREDEDGYIYITDRKKDLIIYKGYNIYPREIEGVLFEHPAVQQCAVVGRPDSEVGEAPIAFVELKKGETATKAEIINHTNSQIAYYKKIRDVVFVEKIPVSGAGKVLKRELRTDN